MTDGASMQYPIKITAAPAWNALRDCLDCWLLAAWLPALTLERDTDNNGGNKPPPIDTAAAHLSHKCGRGRALQKEHRRTKAGTKYQEHDAVHVVVNKVG
ncbi:hypothetical protein THAOC_30011, partial [Thalassiosira oceanica]